MCLGGPLTAEPHQVLAAPALQCQWAHQAALVLALTPVCCAGTMRLGQATVTYDSEAEPCEELPWEHITGDSMALRPAPAACRVPCTA